MVEGRDGTVIDAAALGLTRGSQSRSADGDGVQRATGSCLSTHVSTHRFTIVQNALAASDDNLEIATDKLISNPDQSVSLDGLGHNDVPT